MCFSREFILSSLSIFISCTLIPRIWTEGKEDRDRGKGIQGLRERKAGTEGKEDRDRGKGRHGPTERKTGTEGKEDRDRGKGRQ